MKKKSNILFWGILFLSLLSGCGVTILSQDEFAINNESQVEIIQTSPNEKVTLNIVDWSDSTKKQREVLNQEFMKDYPNVTINYTTLTQAQFNETVVSGIRTGNAPDLFPLPNTMNFSTAIDEGWYLPLNDYLNEAYFQNFQSELFQQNVTNKGKDIYLLPEAQEIPTTLFFYNKDLLKESGIILSEKETLSWDQFIEICQKITEKGQGNYFGLVASGAQKNRIDLELRAFSELAGTNLGQGDQIYLKDLKTQYDSPGVLSAFDFYRQLFKQGSFHPDSASLTAPEARKLFGEGKAAFIIQGAWSIPTWNEQNPDLDYGIMKMPMPSHNMKGKISRPFTKGWMGISSSSKYPDIAAKYLEYLYSYDYQKELVDAGGFVSIRKDLTKEAIDESHMKSYYQLAMAQSNEVENPLVKKLNNQLVYRIIQPIQPDFGDIATSVFSGEHNYQKKLTTYSIQQQKNLNQAINVLKKQRDIQLNDFEFSK